MIRCNIGKPDITQTRTMQHDTTPTQYDATYHNTIQRRTTCYAMLCYAMLCCAVLCCATLRYATLRYAILCYTTLCRTSNLYASATPREWCVEALEPHISGVFASLETGLREVALCPEVVVPD